jgi:hypothetical protein
MSEPRIFTIKTDVNGRPISLTKRDCKFMAARAKGMGDEYYSLAKSKIRKSVELYSDVEATRVALMGLSSEILLKSILYDKKIALKASGTRSLIKEHNLFRLYNLLPSKIQQAIVVRAEIINELKPSEFKDILNNISNAFTVQRYCYELFEVERLYSSMEMIADIIKEISDMYWCESDLRYWNLSSYRSELKSRLVSR